MIRHHLQGDAPLRRACAYLIGHPNGGPRDDGPPVGLVASDGRIFSFDDTGILGSTGSIPLSQPQCVWRPRPDPGPLSRDLRSPCEGEVQQVAYHFVTHV